MYINNISTYFLHHLRQMIQKILNTTQIRLPLDKIMLAICHKILADETKVNYKIVFFLFLDYSIIYSLLPLIHNY